MAESREDYVAYAKAVVQELLGDKRLLISYARSRSRVVGTVVALKAPDAIYYGWSLCNPRDRYSKHIGILKAVERATKDNGGAWPRLALERLSSVLFKLRERAEAYFSFGPPEWNPPR